VPVPEPATNRTVEAGGHGRVHWLPGRPTTVVDPCGDPDVVMDVLTASFSGAGRRMSDVGQLVLTSSRPQCFAAAARLQEITAARIVAHPSAAKSLSDPHAARKARLQHLERTARAAGVPSDVWVSFLETAGSGPPVGSEVPEGSLKLVDEGDTIRAGGYAWHVMHTPGPSPDHVSLLHERSGAMFSGSLLLRNRRTTPALAAKDAEWGLTPLVASMRRVGRLPVSIAWASEGETIRAHRVLVAVRLAGIRRSIASARAAVGAGARTVWEVAEQTGLATDAATLPDVLAETIALLDWLTTRDQLQRQLHGPVVHYSATGTRS
jgi:glyoxylase-like metal-dependent hydrolase (beta-lactamase superfamily II)